MTSTEYGRLCALAALGHRELQKRIQNYEAMLPTDVADPAFIGLLSQANVYCAPWLTVKQLGVMNRVGLWNFGVDCVTDSVARSRREVQRIAKRCLAVAEGGPPTTGDPVTTLLSDLREELTELPLFALLERVWSDDIERMVNAMVREWQWRPYRARAASTDQPSLDEYLSVAADTVGFPYVLTSLWIVGGGPDDAARVDAVGIDAVGAAARAADRVLRLLNDIGSYERDLRQGRLNALLLGTSRRDVCDLVEVFTNDCMELLGDIRESRLSNYVERQIGFNAGLYNIADYRGTP